MIFGKIENMITLPEKVQQIIRILQKGGFEAYAVGGCVRDSILGRKPEDWDITTSARPEEIKRLFRRTVDTGIKHGTVTVLLGKEGFEVTTYRIDGAYEDCRHPKDVQFTSDLAEDLKRRDFTINAMAYNDETGLTDLFDGKGDLDRKVIRAVGDPKERFSEDALRILRAIRFSAQLDYGIEKDTEAAIGKLRQNLEMISAERIRTELQKLLLSDHPEKLQEMRRLGITAVVLPEYDRLSDGQRDQLCAALQCSEKSPVIRLSILLLPVKNEAVSVLRRLKYDNQTIRSVTKLAEYAEEMPDLTPENVRRSMVEIGTDLMSALISLKRSLGQNRDYIDSYEACYQKILADGDCISLKDLRISGNDLIKEMHMQPGKEIGEALQYLFDRVLADPGCNEYDKLLELLKIRRETKP